MTDHKTETTASNANLEEVNTETINKEEPVKDEKEENVTFIGFKRKRPKNIRKKSEDDQKYAENEQNKNSDTKDTKDDTKETHTVKKPKTQKGILSIFLPPLLQFDSTLFNILYKVTQILCSFNDERKDSKGRECHIRIPIIQDCSSCRTS
jgi:hypothetical protein